MDKTPPNIFIFLEYRSYLKAFYEYSKRHIIGFTYRSFSEQVGVNATNFLQLLIQNKRNLKESTIPKVALALNLKKGEADYFKTLVLFDQENVIAKKIKLFNELNEKRKPYNIDLLTESQFEHFKNWYNKAIRELLGFYPFFPDEKYAYRTLGSKLHPPIKEKEARNSVKQLLELGLLEKNKEGRIVQTQRFISTGDDINSLFLRKFHETMITLSAKSLDTVKKENRDISSLTVSISDNGFETIKKEIQLFRKRLLDVVKSDKDPKNVYQINFQSFPLTKIKSSNNSDN